MTQRHEAIQAYAHRALATKHGVGMVPPFYAETASVKGDEESPHWIVRNKTCNSLGKTFSRRDAEELAAAMNAAAGSVVSANQDVKQALYEIVGHLGAAKMQRAPSDDQIIAEHIDHALGIASKAYDSIKD